MKLPGLIALGIAALSSLSAQQQVFPDIPEVRGHFTLSAVIALLLDTLDTAAMGVDLPFKFT